MNHFLKNQSTTDSSAIKFDVLDVTFFEGKNGFICEFQVHMIDKSGGMMHDTIGKMNANVSKDYKLVLRR